MSVDAILPLSTVISSETGGSGTDSGLYGRVTWGTTVCQIVCHSGLLINFLWETSPLLIIRLSQAQLQPHIKDDNDSTFVNSHNSWTVGVTRVSQSEWGGALLQSWTLVSRLSVCRTETRTESVDEEERLTENKVKERTDQDQMTPFDHLDPAWISHECLV